MHSHEEELLEPVARQFRYRTGIKYIPKNKPVIIVDLGCGPKARFYKYATKKGVKIKKYIGIDPLIKSNLFTQNNIVIYKSSLNEKVPLPKGNADFVVGFAFLEHINNPEIIINDGLRVLKKGGRAIFTAPTPKAKKILEFLSFKLGLISKREIAEHKNYFTKDSLIELINDKNNYKVIHSYFELGLNNIFVLEKLK